ncbi:MAG: peptide ABC transporter substrate-binding protein [Francisellaceae bacterium]
MKIGKLKKTLALTTATALMALLAACGNQAQKSSDSSSQDKALAPPNKDTITLGVGGSVPTLDPALVNDQTSSRVVDDLFEGLVSENQDNEPVPGVAKSWDISKDGKVYTFHLRENARWSNGQPVIADDFVFAIKRTLDPTTGAPNAGNLDMIENARAILDGRLNPDKLGIKAVDAHTLQITLAHPLAYFPSVLTNTIAFPVYPPAIKKWGKAWAQPGHMVSNGAYAIKEWIPNGHLLAVKNPNYWDHANVKIPRVIYLPISNMTDSLNQYNAGQIDMTYWLPPGRSAEQYRQQYGSQFVDVTMLGTYYYAFNTKLPGLDKVSVRKALTMTIDRKAIVDHILRMGQTPLYGIVPDGIQSGMYKDLYKQLPSYDWVDQPLDQRQQEAKKLMQEAGFSAQHPLKITILYNTDQGHLLVAQAIIQMWKDAFGDMIEAKTENEEWKVFLQTVNQHKFDVARQSWIADFNAASNFVTIAARHGERNARSSRPG